MIRLEDRHYKIVKNILSKYPYHFYVFGSRAKGNPRKFSDLDLCYKEPIPGSILVRIDEAFEESDLPFKVDLVDFNHCSTSFRNLIQKDLEPLE